MLFGKANVKMIFVYTERIKSEHASFFETENQMVAYHVKDMHKKKHTVFECRQNVRALKQASWIVPPSVNGCPWVLMRIFVSADRLSVLLPIVCRT